MADTALQPRSRHLVAVFALLISSVGGFAPQTPRRFYYPNDAVAPASPGSATSTLARSSRPPHLHRGRRRQRGEWSGAGEQRWPGAWCGQGLARREAAEQQRTGKNKSFVLGSEAGSAGRGLGLGLPHKQSSTSVMMALHFPKPPKMPKPPPSPPPPSPSGDRTPAGGTSAGRDASPSPSTPVGSTGGSAPLGDESSISSSSSTKADANGAEGVVNASGIMTKTRNVSVGHANATSTDLNGGKTVRRRRTTSTSSIGGGGGDLGKAAPASTATSGTKQSSLPRKRRAAGATTSAGETRKLKRRPRRPTSGTPADGTPGVKALVVTDDMELTDIMALVEDVLERLSETERELRRLRKEGSLAKPNRAEVRERKFVIDTRAKMLGAAFAGAVAGMIVGWSVLPNLWLVGGVTGAVAFAALSRSSTGTAGSICSTCGIQVALIYKDIRDWWEQTVFLYKTGKLSYTYWRGFERYDQAWGLTTKYSEAVAKVSKEALELDRQYKIRQKALRAGKRLTKLSRQVGSSAAKEVTTFASSATEWGSNQLREWGLLGDYPDAVEESPGVFGGLLKSKKRLTGGGRGDSGGAKKRRPLGFSVVLDGVFGERSRSIYSAPPAGGSRKPGYRGDPVIPARIRHMFMTSKQIRDERLQKYRVGFMGMRLARSFDKDD